MTAAEATRAAERPHPGTRQYLLEALLLLVVTVAEVTIFYVPALHPILVPALLTLSVAKFAMVAMFYMHLRFDGRLFSWVFLTPLGFAVAVIVGLMVLFHVL